MDSEDCEEIINGVSGLVFKEFDCNCSLARVFLPRFDLIVIIYVFLCYNSHIILFIQINPRRVS